ncbi:MAG: ABC transporter substrate-binding protein [Calditrichia bacterium]
MSHPGLEQDEIVKLYYIDNISAAHQKIVDNFNNKYRGKIEVIPVNLPFEKFSTNERKELLARSLRSKNRRIDIFAVDLIWVKRFAKWSEPLELYFPQPNRKLFIEEAFISCYHDDVLYAIPFYIDIGLMYYREDIIKKLPDSEQIIRKLKNSISWKDLLDLRQKYFRDKKDFFLFSAKNFEGLICFYLEFLSEHGGTLLGSDGVDSINLCTPEAVATLEKLQRFMYKEQFIPKNVVNFNDDDVYNYALKNDVPFFRGWPGFKTQFIAADQILRKKASFVQPAMLPHVVENGAYGVYGGWNFMISKFSEHKKEAAEFIQFAISEESQKILHEFGGYIPVNRFVYEDKRFLAKHKELIYLKNLLQTGFHRPYREDYTRISDIISFYVHKALKGEMTAAEALKEASYYINAKKYLLK